jgi:hypothetical protein
VTWETRGFKDDDEEHRLLYRFLATEPGPVAVQEAEAWRAANGQREGLAHVIARARVRALVRRGICHACQTEMVKRRCYVEGCYQDFTNEGHDFIAAVHREAATI